MTDRIAFTLNGRALTLPPDTSPTASLLDWLRGPAALRGTKEGCAEGDCGACTVVLEGADGSRTPVNACLTLLGQLHGRAVRSVEGLAAADGTPHAVARALAEADGTQCGFCTPGIVMSAWAQLREGGDPHDALAGNLCRCTGYRPVLDAMARLQDDGAAPPAVPPPASASFATPAQRFELPATLTEAVALRAAMPQAWVLAGGTDLGLRVSEHREQPAEVLCLLQVAELQALTIDTSGIHLGAATSYARLLRAVEGDVDFAPLVPLLRRLGSRQIRGLGTLGGNLGTASPIGDALPPLLALGASVTLASPGGARSLPVEQFLLGYRRNALAADELIIAAFLPRPAAGARLLCEKLSKRHDQDIATVGLSALITRRGGKVDEIRLAFGGMAASAARAPRAEAALRGARWCQASLDAAAAALAEDFAPLSDLRASAAYRIAAAQGLVRRLWWRLETPDMPSDIMALAVPHAPRFADGIA